MSTRRPSANHLVIVRDNVPEAGAITLYDLLARRQHGRARAERRSRAEHRSA
jgi:hypothetical protein